MSDATPNSVPRFVPSCVRVASFCSALTWLGLVVTPSAEAQGQADERPSAVVLQTTSGADLRDLAQATGRLIRVEVDRAQVVLTAGTPALYLEDLQMALGCLGETPECLTVVAQELGVSRLVYGSLERSGARLLLTVAYFDGPQVRVVTRGVEAPAPDAAILDTIPPLVREVFGLSPLPTEAPTVVAAPQQATPPVARPTPSPREPRSPQGVRAGAYVSAGVALASLGAFVYAGTQHRAAEDDYRSATTDTPADVDAALGERERAIRLGRAATSMAAVAGASAVSAVVCGILARKRSQRRDEPAVSASVLIGPRVVGLSIGGSL